VAFCGRCNALNLVFPGTLNSLTRVKSRFDPIPFYLVTCKGLNPHSFNLIKYNYTILMHISTKILKFIKIVIFYLYIKSEMVLLDGATDGKYQVLERCEVRSSCRSEQ